MAKRTIPLAPNWLGLLGIIFVLCKIFQVGVIATWSWWIVLLPFYWFFAAILIFILSALGVGAFAGVAIMVLTAYDHVRNKIRRYFRAKKELKMKIWKDLGGKE